MIVPKGFYRLLGVHSVSNSPFILAQCQNGLLAESRPEATITKITIDLRVLKNQKPEALESKHLAR